MIKITKNEVSHFFTEKQVIDMEVYDHISLLLKNEVFDHAELHEIAADVQGWAELATIDEVYDLSEYDILVECIEE